MTKKFLAPPLNEDDAVFQEVIDSLRLTESVFGLKKAVEAVIDTAMRKTASDGVPQDVAGKFLGMKKAGAIRAPSGAKNHLRGRQADADGGRRRGFFMP